MSEYWKSTPKYWCKYCETFVKDTKFDRQQHDATPKHQGRIQRSLRNIHKENERAERDKDRAKAEVARLNGIVAGTGTAQKGGFKPAQPPAAQNSKGGVEERKRQMQQLADLGVAVPKEYRKEMAMAGEWETVAVRQVKQEEDVKPDVLNIGVRKRKHEGEEEEEEAGATVVRKGWGSTTRAYSGSMGGTVEDIGALMNSGRQDGNVEHSPVVKQEEDAPEVETTSAQTETTGIEEEEDAPSAAPIAPVVFKKRKPKRLK